MTLTPPLVSVIIPNWNGASHLPTCLDALRRQKRLQAESVEELSAEGGLERHLPLVQVDMLERLEREELRRRIDAGLSQLSDAGDSTPFFSCITVQPQVGHFGTRCLTSRWCGSYPSGTGWLCRHSATHSSRQTTPTSRPAPSLVMSRLISPILAMPEPNPAALSMNALTSS